MIGTTKFMIKNFYGKKVSSEKQKVTMLWKGKMREDEGYTCLGAEVCLEVEGEKEPAHGGAVTNCATERCTCMECMRENHGSRLHMT